MSLQHKAMPFDKKSSDPTVDLPSRVSTNILGFTIDKSAYNINYHGELSTSQSDSLSFTTIFLIIIALIASLLLCYLYCKYGRKVNSKISVEPRNSQQRRTDRSWRRDSKETQTPLHTIEIA
jgi:preprotein translocase subunit SecG